MNTVSDDSVRQTTVLVVDDSRAQRQLLSSSLRKWGFNVLQAGTGRAALEICKTERVELVVSDWMMPEMDGLEFCSAFRALDRGYYGYFILLTSKSEKNDVAAGLEVGADDFLSKPVNAMELRARLRAGLRLLDMENRLLDQNKRTSTALTELQLLYESVDRDLLAAEKLQQSLMPVRDRQLPNGRVSMHVKSVGHVGGDLTGFFRFSDSRLGIYSIDVSGHGVSSALMTARLAGYISGHSKSQNVAFEPMHGGHYRNRSPEQVAAILNERLLSEIDTDMYFTLVFADINLDTGHVALVQAGHPSPAVLNPQGKVTFHGDGGMPVGLVEHAVFERLDLILNPGDRLILYSDGITECANPAGVALAEGGFRAMLAKHAKQKGMAFLDCLFRDLGNYAQKDAMDDDISAIVFEFTTAAGIRSAEAAA